MNLFKIIYHSVILQLWFYSTSVSMSPDPNIRGRTPRLEQRTSYKFVVFLTFLFSLFSNRILVIYIFSRVMTFQPKSCLIWVWQLSSIHISQSTLHNSKQPPKLLSTSLGNISKAEFKVLLSWRRGHVGKQRQSFSCPVRKPATGWHKYVVSVLSVSHIWSTRDKRRQ